MNFATFLSSKLKAQQKSILRNKQFKKLNIIPLLLLVKKIHVESLDYQYIYWTNRIKCTLPPYWIESVFIYYMNITSLSAINGAFLQIKKNNAIKCKILWNCCISFTKKTGVK